MSKEHGNHPDDAPLVSTSGLGETQTNLIEGIQMLRLKVAMAAAGPDAFVLPIVEETFSRITPETKETPPVVTNFLFGNEDNFVHPGSTPRTE